MIEEQIERPKVIGQWIADRYALYHGDAVEVMKGIPSDSIHCSIFSPPFSGLYQYTDSQKDMSNVRNDAEFFAGIAFMFAELFRVMMPGRLVSAHCMNLPRSKERDGVIGIKDFRGDLIRAFEAHGFIYHSEVVIWKDPLIAATRTHALGLAHQQIVKDSAMCRVGIPDYLVTMRKPGENPRPISHTKEEFPVARWQQYASPIWMDINPSDTLQRTSAREHADEKHIAPLQLTVIRRAIELWTAPNDLVCSPFAGIGSEGYVAISESRQFIGVELKRSYWQQACANLQAAADHKPLDLLEGA